MESGLPSLNGKPLSSYPKIVKIKGSDLLNIYWSNDINCNREPENCARVVNQSVAVRIQNRLDTVVGQRISAFDRFASKVIPRWTSLIRPRLFPLNIEIQLGQEIMSAGSVFDPTKVEIFSASGESHGLVDIGRRISVGIQQAASLESVDTLVMHEFGHMVLRALGFAQLQSAKSGRVDSVLEEMLCDFISSSFNADTPFIAPGLQDRVRKFAEDGLKDSKSDAFQRALMEGHLQGISSKSMRDFTLPFVYEDLYLLPSHYVYSLHLNGILYRLKKVIPSELLTTVVLRTVVEQPGILMHGDTNQVLQGLIEFYARLYPVQYSSRAAQIRTIVRQSGWKASQPTSQQLEIDLFADDERGVNVRIKPAASLTSSIYLATMRCLTYTILANGRPIFSLTQFLDYSMQRRLRFLPVDACDQSSPLCICGTNKEKLSLEAVFLNEYKVVNASMRTAIPANALQSAACYNLSFEWE